ncbi:asparaginase [Candidatus Woesearchaeota archaeon]|nr:asparaginase [Candidatus Woesearchaeota archaeon]
MKLTFIQTGGTIDKDYPKTKGGYAFEISEPAVGRILEKLNPSFEYEILSVLRKDSLDITEEDRKKILESCKKVKTDKLIITHGTDTMLDTAGVLNEIKDKTIIITGAMRPERFSNSDAPINIGLAIGAINVLEKGIFIAMHGRILRWDKCKRDTKSGQFIEQ